MMMYPDRCDHPNSQQGPRVLSSRNSSTIALKALSIVLQHYMVPELGWSMKSCQDELLGLKQSIMEHKVSNMDLNEQKIVRDMLENTLSNDPIHVSHELFVHEVDSIRLKLEEIGLFPVPFSVS